MSDMTTSQLSARFDKEWLKRASQSIQHPLTRALLVLTFTTGLVDAVSYLGLGRVFTANMTGNIVLLGFGIAGGVGLPVLAPLVSLGSFLLGAAGGGVLAKRMGERHPEHIARALAIEVSLIGIAAGLAAALTVRPNAVSGDIVIALLAFAMGVRNATVRRIGVPDLTTTVLTMTLTGLAADSPVAGGSGKGSVRRIAAVLAMLTGALAGALLLKTSLVLPLAAAAGLVLLTWLVYIPAARRGLSAQRRASASLSARRARSPEQT
jgi:uncharacterized membrane protein YoaK (UPF0700 family)